jgi:hypothetical protein
MRNQAAGPEPSQQMDDHFILQWVGWGMTDFARYLEKHAAFDAWCAAHPQEET